MIEKFQKSLDQGGEYAALLTDLSKAFECLPHDLIIAKWHAYGFDNPSLRLMHSYWHSYWQTGIRQSKSIVPIAFGVSSKDGLPQGLILGPLLFNICLCDMFFMVDNIDIANDNNNVMLMITSLTV